MMGTPVAKVPSPLRKSRGSIAELSLANSLAGSLGCFGASDIRQASKRQVFGWQAERHPAVIGARSIEIESQMRIHRMRLEELPLQGAQNEQAARTARREQQRHSFGAQIDREGAVAPQPGFARDVRDA